VENLDHRDHRGPQEPPDNRVVLDQQDHWGLLDNGVKTVFQEYKAHKVVGGNQVSQDH
jgi:hypothetical protein